MKKVYSFILIFILSICIGINFESNADMSAPIIDSYDVYVTNVNGAKYYDTTEWDLVYGSKLTEKGIIQYNQKITIEYEEEIKNEKYGIFHLEGDNFSYYINLKDVSKLENKYTSYDKDSKVKAVILCDEGVEMYDGPSYAYNSKNIIIPKGTTLNSYRKDSTNESGDLCPWVYVTYNGKSGWICELNGRIGFESKYVCKLKTTYNTYIFKSLEERNKFIWKYDHNKDFIAETIPANTEIEKENFKEVDPWSESYYITYNGISGYVYEDDFSCSYYYNVNDSINYENTNIYEFASTGSKVLLKDIPVGAEIEESFSTDIRGQGWIYGKYNNVEGWIYYFDEGYFEEKEKEEFNLDTFYNHIFLESGTEYLANQDVTENDDNSLNIDNTTYIDNSEDNENIIKENNDNIIEKVEPIHNRSISYSNYFNMLWYSNNCFLYCFYNNFINK